VAAIFLSINYLILKTILLHSVAGWLWNGPYSLVFILLCNSLPLSVGWPSNLLLTSRIQQKWLKGVTLVIRSHKIIASMTLVDSTAFLACTLNNQSCWRSPCGKELRSAISQLETVDLSARANNHVRLDMGRLDPFPCWAFRWDWTLAETFSLALWETLKQKTQQSYAQTPDP